MEQDRKIENIIQGGVHTGPVFQVGMIFGEAAPKVPLKIGVGGEVIGEAEVKEDGTFETEIPNDGKWVKWAGEFQEMSPEGQRLYAMRLGDQMVTTGDFLQKIVRDAFVLQTGPREPALCTLCALDRCHKIADDIPSCLCCSEGHTNGS